jgi:hypothetical protein
MASDCFCEVFFHSLFCSRSSVLKHSFYDYYFDIMSIYLSIAILSIPSILIETQPGCHSLTHRKSSKSVRLSLSIAGFTGFS